MNIAYAGKIAAGAGNHIIGNVFLAVTHEFFHQRHKGVVDGNILVVQGLHPRLFRVVPRYLAGRNRHDMPGRRQRRAQRVVVGGDSQRQRPAGGKAAGADVPAAIKVDHSPVALVNHGVARSDAVFRTERIEREPHVAAGIPAQLAHDGQVALVGADDHAAAEEIEDRPLGGLRLFPDDQAGKAAYIDRFIVSLAIGGNEYAAVTILLFDHRHNFVLRQGKGLFRPGDPVGRAQQGSKNAHDLRLPFFNGRCS